MWDLMATIKAQVINNGGKFTTKTWDLEQGKIEIKWCVIWYKIDWEIINIDVLDKPFLVSTSYVEEKILELFKKHI